MPPLRDHATLLYSEPDFAMALEGAAVAFPGIPYGSARQEEVDAAPAYDAHLVTAYRLHGAGMEAVLARIPDGGRYHVTIDTDGMDPSCAPGVTAPCPGGVGFVQARALLRGLVGKGRVVGLDVVEITPRTDVNALTCITAGRLIVNLLAAAAVRAGHLG